ncbi:MAG: hypothetical protein ABSE52_12130 [Candidatus Dormibacteria bacterium]|jgi:hypothetical protein
MSVLVTGLLLAAAVAILALIVAGPIRAVREDRGYALEEQAWLASGRFPAQVEREYRHSRLILTDGTRLRELGYELEERRTVRGAWGRLQAVTWRAASAPAMPEETRDGIQASGP